MIIICLFFLLYFSAKTFNEKGHQSMTVSFYLTGQQRSGVVAVKVQKVNEQKKKSETFRIEFYFFLLEYFK